jgi:hypothetical protein
VTLWLSRAQNQMGKQHKCHKACVNLRKDNEPACLTRCYISRTRFLTRRQWRMLVRGARRLSRAPWNNGADGRAGAALQAMADHTRRNLTVTPWPAAAPLVVTSRIFDAAANQVATGTYDSGTGIHAEVAAINSLAAIAWVNPHTILTSLEPCPRCAVILRAFQMAHGWTIQAPARAFASNWAGAYALPDDIFTVVLNQMNISALDRMHYSEEIKSAIKTFESR